MGLPPPDAALTIYPATMMEQVMSPARLLAALDPMVESGALFFDIFLSMRLILSP